MSYRIQKRKRSKNGKVIVDKHWTARIRMSWMPKEISKSLECTDQQIAQKRLKEYVQRLELEHAGEFVPSHLWGGEEKSIDSQLESYLKSLKSQNRGDKHIRDTGNRLKRLIKEIGWKTANSIKAVSFEEWRSNKAISLTDGRPLSAKSKNEYLTSANAFLNWMVKTEQMEKNPLNSVTKSETRGNEVKKRRCWTDFELTTVINSGVFYAIAIFLAARTGLRRKELRKLCWGDVNLDTENPFIFLRAATTKNKKSEPIPLLEDAIEVLKGYRPLDWKPCEKVLKFRIPNMPRIRKDYEALGLIYTDSLGRDLDFHALRHTYLTNLSKNGVRQRAIQSLGRHSDPRLSANIYTDASQIDTFQDVKNIPSLLDPDTGTRIGTLFADIVGHLVTSGGRRRRIAPLTKDADSEPSRREKSPSDALGQILGMVGMTGFEPATSTSRT